MSAKAKSATKKVKANDTAPKNKQHVFIFPDSSVYEGEIKDEASQPIVRHGKGKLTLVSNSVTYQGDWVNDKMHGKGRLEFADGSFYEGDFKENAFDGQGRFQWANNLAYEGQWTNNLMSGHGVFTDTEQGKWQGQFQAGHGEALTAVLEAAF